MTDTNTAFTSIFTAPKSAVRPTPHEVQRDDGTFAPVFQPPATSAPVPLPIVIPNARRTYEPTNTEADIYPGTTWHGRVSHTTNRTVTITSLPFTDTDGVRRCGIATTGERKTRRYNATVEHVLSAYARDPDDKQAPDVLTLERAAKAAAVANVTNADAPTADAATGQDEPAIVVGQIRLASSDPTQPKPHGTISTVVVTAQDGIGASGPFYRVRAGFPSIVPNDAWEGTISSADLVILYPVVKDGHRFFILPPRVDGDAAVVPPAICTVQPIQKNAPDTTTPPQQTTAADHKRAVAPHQIRSTGGTDAGTVTSVWVDRVLPTGEYVIRALRPSIVNVNGWYVSALSAETIERLWPTYVGTNVSPTIDPIVSPGEYRAPQFNPSAVVIDPALGQTRSGVDGTIYLWGYDDDKYICNTNDDEDEARFKLSARDIKIAYPRVVNVETDHSLHIVVGQYRDGADGFIRRIKITGYNIRTNTFTVAGAVPGQQANWRSALSPNEVIRNYPVVSVDQKPIDPAQFSPDSRITIGESRTALAWSSIRVDGFDTESNLYRVTATGSPLEILQQETYTANDIIDRWPEVVDESAKSDKVYAPDATCAQVEVAILDYLRAQNGVAPATIVMIDVAKQFNSTAICVHSVADGMIANNKIESFYRGVTKWRIAQPNTSTNTSTQIATLARMADGTFRFEWPSQGLTTFGDTAHAAVKQAYEEVWGGVHEPPPPPPAQSDDDAILSRLDGWTADKVRVWARSIPKDAAILYGIGEAQKDKPVSIAQVVRTLALRANGWGNPSHGLGLVR